ncbi:MAG: DNA polymerase/3'-5' exonuclease PolX [Candidatus Aminicenantes bacterium]|nr:DNA polymerase/3'-5' exonuclease PolX [Candidatus Aminicenantes bacterium]
MKNQEIAAIFNGIADILDIKGANPFRIRAYRKAAQNIENLTEDIAAIAARNDLEAIPGIGKDLAGKIQDFVSTGTLKYYDELKKEVPSGIVTLLAVPGVGPRTAKLIFEHFGISSVEEVERLAIDHKIQGLPGIKAKTEQNILKGIAILKKGRERLPVGAFLPVAEEIINIMKKKCPVSRISVAGSLRRRRETIKDIDLLVASDKPAKVMEVFTELPVVGEIIAHGETKSSIRMVQGISVDLRVVEPKSFGAALCYFTGSKAHNIRVRELAVRRGLKINEYGVFRGEKWIGGKTEKDVFKAVGLPYIPPELREDRGEIEAALAGQLPVLVEMKDIRGDLHVHSKYSDGTASLFEIASKAAALGFSWVAICDHSASLKIAGGLSPADLKKKIAAIRNFNQKSDAVKLLCGTEVDIDTKGNLDYPDDILRQLDIVIAAIHTGFKQDEKTLTRRITSAMRNPHVDIIAHPTGRLIGERDPYAVNVEKIIKVAAETKTAMEINAYFKRLDLNDIQAKVAKENGCKLAIGTDTHILEQMEFMHLGVSVARRAWLTPQDLLNTLTYSELTSYLGKDKRR